MVEIKAWRPAVEGVAEVFHAHFGDHAYPSHTHDTWTLLILDDGLVRYDLDKHEHGAARDLVTLLPPHVPHDGRSVNRTGFRKRVIYLDADVLADDLIGPSVDHPDLSDGVLRRQIDRLHGALAFRGEDLEAHSRLALVNERLTGHLGGLPSGPPPAVRRLAPTLREMLDAHVVDGIRLQDAATVLNVTPAHLVRTFTATYGIAPHRYLTGRRIDAARKLLLAGQPAAEAAVAAGFFDQAHLTRHFRRMLGTTPGRYARSSGVGGSALPQ